MYWSQGQSCSWCSLSSIVVSADVSVGRTLLLCLWYELTLFLLYIVKLSLMSTPCFDCQTSRLCLIDVPGHFKKKRKMLRLCERLYSAFLTRFPMQGNSSVSAFWGVSAACCTEWRLMKASVLSWKCFCRCTERRHVKLASSIKCGAVSLCVWLHDVSCTGCIYCMCFPTCRCVCKDAHVRYTLMYSHAYVNSANPLCLVLSTLLY